MSSVVVIVVVGTCIVVVASLTLDGGEPATALGRHARGGVRRRRRRQSRPRAGAGAHARSAPAIAPPTVPSPAVARPVAVLPPTGPVPLVAPPVPLPEPDAEPTTAVAVARVRVAAGPRGEPVRESSPLHRLGSASLLCILSVLLGVAAAAAIGILALATFVLIRAAVG